MNYIGQNRSPASVVLLTIVTCGIYGLYWYYTMMKDMNGALNEQRFSPGTMILLCFFCPPVLYYVLYKLDQGLVELGMKENLTYASNFVMWLLLTLLLGVGEFVAQVQITSAFNTIWTNRRYARG